MGDSGERAFLCPRCGYDQRGIVATWRESCPLQSTCAECGLVYSCAEVICPEKFEPQWCVEYCQGQVMPFLRACAKTFAMSFLPWRFWSRVMMSHRIKSRRIALYILMLVLPVAVLYVTIQASVALYARSNTQIDIVASAQNMAAWAARQPNVRPVSQHERESLQRDHPEDWQDRLEAHQRNWEAWLERCRAAADQPPYLEHSSLEHVLEAVFLPLASRSRLRIVHPVDQTRQPYYFSPIYLWLYGLGPTARRYMISASACLIFGVVLGLMFPVSLALLPLSRRKAKVRWAHIGRVTAYWSFILATAMFLFLAAATGMFARFSITSVEGLEWTLLVLAVGFTPLATFAWWTFAIHRYLKMPHAFAVTALLLFLCSLTILATIYLFMRQWLFGPYV